MSASIASAKVYAQRKPKSLWEKICEEFEAKRIEYEEQDIDDAASVSTDVTQFSVSRHTPIVYGKMVHNPPVDSDVAENFDPAVSHPAAVGLSLLDKPKPKLPAPGPPPPNPKLCSAKDYLQAYIFPTLLPALEAMLQQARKERCFERKRTKFNACDFLTEYLYQNNPHKQEDGRKDMSLWDIIFVKRHLNDHPRPPLPLSLLWTEEEAAVKIQSFWRGHLVRIIPEIQELRQWQKEWREENTDIREKVDDFWHKKENNVDSSSPLPKTPLKSKST